jgi:hypothetical protein
LHTVSIGSAASSGDSRDRTEIRLQFPISRRSRPETRWRNRLPYDRADRGGKMTTQVKRPPVVQFVGGVIVTALIIPLIILGAGGNWQWLEGWLFALWFDVMVLANMSYLCFKDPALLAERRKRPGADNQKGWDAVMLSGIYILALARAAAYRARNSGAGSTHPWRRADASDGTGWLRRV